MGLFKKKKNKRTEEINLNINIDNDLSMEDNKKEMNSNFNLKSSDQLIDEIITNFKNVLNKNNQIIKDYYMCKIFSRVGLKDLDFNLQVITMDKHVNKLKRECFELSRIIDNIKLGVELPIEQLIKIDNQVTELKAFQSGLFNQLIEINNASYGHLKITTVNVTINKSNQELEKLYNNISKELKDFKNFNDASDYIYFHSGDFVSEIVNNIVNCVKETNNEDYIFQYDKKYFIESDEIISLEYKEWIDLYNKCKFVLRLLKNYKTINYLNCIEQFDTLEAKYAILMMDAERNQNKRRK